MADLLGQGARWLDSQRRDFASRDLVYTRGTSSVTVPATSARSEFEINDASGFMTRLELHDEIITVTDLVIDGVKVEPRQGDRLAVDGVTYMVCALGSEPCWRFTDQFRIAYRIHSKETARS